MGWAEGDWQSFFPGMTPPTATATPPSSSPSVPPTHEAPVTHASAPKHLAAPYLLPGITWCHLKQPEANHLRDTDLSVAKRGAALW